MGFKCKPFTEELEVVVAVLKGAAPASSLLISSPAAVTEDAVFVLRRCNFRRVSRGLHWYSIAIANAGRASGSAISAATSSAACFNAVYSSLYVLYVALASVRHPP